MRQTALAAAIAFVAGLASSSTGWAQANELRIAKQFGLGYLQLIVAQDRELMEKHAKAAGLGDVKVTWATFRSSDVMNDALISGNVDYVCLGIPGLATIWARTRGSIDVRGVAGLNALPLTLTSRNPAIKSIRDFTDKDRIALPAVKVSMQAIMLQMAAAKEWGDSAFAKLDHLTVQMSHPDGTAQMLSPGGEITSHFTSLPFSNRQLATPGIHKVLTSTDIVGGKLSFNIIAATSKFRNANPKLHAVFLAGMADATAQINADRRSAAETYARVTGDKTPVAELEAMIADPDNEYTIRPFNVLPMIEFMHKTGAIKVKPANMGELMFPDAPAS
jgi:NitT/TauT family transport system substrate-binding protein